MARTLGHPKARCARCGEPTLGRATCLICAVILVELHELSVTRDS